MCSFSSHFIFYLLPFHKILEPFVLTDGAKLGNKKATTMQHCFILHSCCKSIDIMNQIGKVDLKRTSPLNIRKSTSVSVSSMGEKTNLLSLLCK